uniref:NADH dehydrogenase subunit 6 n=1 Tax=Picromerus lewisi TaxID=763226 RepID=UPI001D0FC51D|nr:NADH dehydrogenase subunit 6 [Picromerus lewisi]QZP40904.1 NADH dehydrogenase subunit 6 [Picromerus lewisi]URT60198.1 NADH dehydrogenase subunit 6 [Picromerus lewisi]UYG49494.1 NADH dehydrogenase subunit 6 [Picromerus lewisi]WQM56497.1 NADH dehydrogenase subunit 6 [Picromerus lewisi]
MNILLSMMIVMSLVLLSLNHPLSMGLILIIQTLITSTIIGFMLGSFFFSYIIIIIMLSGSLVLFIYMASVASNEKFKSPINMMFISSISMMFIMSLSFMYLYKSYLKNELYYNDTITLIKIFNTITAQLTLLMIIYLLFTMIVVSNVSKTNEGPLRMKN